jgi:hypothetical protein
MKELIVTGLAAIAALHTVNAIAQQPDEDAAGTAQDSEIYLEEIRVACEAEAAGLPDAEQYINECIKSMKQSFTDAQD